MGGPELMIVTAIWAPMLVFLWLMVRRPSDRSVAAFAKTYFVPLTTHNVDQLRRYIQWTRRWRLGGVIVANLLAGVVSLLAGRGGFGWIPIVVGYSVGSMVGELVRPTDRPANIALATLQHRRMRDYVTTPALGAAGVVFIASLIPAVYLLLSNPHRSWVDRTEPLGDRPQDWFVVLLTGLSIATALACWLGGRALAQAPAPADTPDRQAVRHAIRSSAIMSLVGGAVMTTGAIGSKLGGVAITLDHSVDRSQVMTAMLTVSSLTCVLLAIAGAMATLTSVPRFSPFSGRLPEVPFPEPTPNG